MEIERKFLVKEMPLNLGECFSHRIEQSYLSFNPEVRIRKDNDNYYLTVKSEGTLSREEFETDINANIFIFLSNKAQRTTIRKNRYRISLYDNLIAEVDIYSENKFVNATVEVEFKDEIKASEFKIPNWFGEEVTYDKRYKNSSLARL